MTQKQLHWLITTHSAAFGVKLKQAKAVLISVLLLISLALGVYVLSEKLTIKFKT